jgi:hypothetical protein
LSGLLSDGHDRQAVGIDTAEPLLRSKRSGGVIELLLSIARKEVG